MRLLVTNLSSTDPVDVPSPFSVTLAPSGTKTLGVDPSDFLSGDAKGAPLWKKWDNLLRQGLISVTPEANVAGPSLSILSIVQSNVVDDALAVTGDLSVGGKATVTGDLAAAGGFRRNIGPFVRDNVAASLTASRAAVGATAAPQVDIAVPRAGSVMGISLSSTVAPAGSTASVQVYLNGALLNAGCALNVTVGAALGRAIAFAKDLYPVAAGDRLGIAITTDGSWTATTADVAVDIEVEC